MEPLDIGSFGYLIGAFSMAFGVNDVNDDQRVMKSGEFCAVCGKNFLIRIE